MYYVLASSGEYPNCFYCSEFETEQEAVDYYQSQARYSSEVKFIKGAEQKLCLTEVKKAWINS